MGRNISLKDIFNDKNYTEIILQLYEESSDVLMFTDLKGNIIYLNKVWEELTGYKTKESVGKNFRDFIHESDLEPTEKAFSGLINNEKIQNLENRFIRSDSSYIDFLWNGIKLKDQDLIVGTARNLTDFKYTLNKYSFLVQGLDEQITVIEPDGNIVEVINRDMNNQLITSEEDLVGKNVKELINPELYKKYEELLKKLLNTQSKQELIEKSPLDEEKWFRTKLQPVVHNNEIKNILILTKDVSSEILDKEKIKKRIKELEKLNSLMVNRELKMKELKRKIQELEESHSSAGDKLTTLLEE